MLNKETQTDHERIVFLPNEANCSLLNLDGNFLFYSRVCPAYTALVESRTFLEKYVNLVKKF
ncbi:hypothetical protein TELCIR_01089 [Teladorsagia circumcincta]|uniref:Uncharacterized protein n=1 Tax=Teladorsagia circumcincta TaxID=45464 RepID=A0A2G9V2W7_TELCI|nr:hypothetical protein TELCIR_01089 [Teladorsagia circumcincta]